MEVSRDLAVNLSTEMVSAAALEAFDQLRENVLNYAQTAQNYVVTRENLDSAIELAKYGAQMSKMVDTKRTEIKAPVLNAGREIDRIAKILSEPLSDGLLRLKGGIGRVQKEIEAENFAKLKAAEEERRRLEQLAAAKVIKEEEMKDLVAVHKEISEASEKPKNVQHYWTFSVEDPTLIPMAYMIPNMQAIQNAVRQGVREIPGIKIYQDSRVVLR